MSVAFESNSGSDSNRIQSQGFSHRMWIYNRSDSSRFAGGNSWSSRLPVVIEEDYVSSSSSIGKNSNVGGSAPDEDDGEVQSRANEPLNGLNAFEEVLPVKRGISTFYDGKSKSFGSLADASSVPSIHDIAKPEDAYSRKRKSILAHNVVSDKHCGISKRLAHSSRIGVAFGSNINNHNSDEYGEISNSDSSLPSRSLPPLPRNRRRRPTNESSDSSPRLHSSLWRSLSLSDLEHATAAPSNITGSASPLLRLCLLQGTILLRTNVNVKEDFWLKESNYTAGQFVVLYTRLRLQRRVRDRKLQLDPPLLLKDQGSSFKAS